MSTDGSIRNSDEGHGRLPTDFGELRRLLANPSDLEDEHRQRLQNLALRAARVRTFGGGHQRVEVSEYVERNLPAGTPG